ncbi:hypothetical protein [Butyrivibrio fibrisolvens]|uniref:hypothetical protein n=1 Tax=Butyrivibrio fibrisolvens TaxID=831 RepID=UPI0004088F49|nr:hypothetical protein [Butyrivibrio fibrisolvens]
MVTCISYGDKKYCGAAKLNLESARDHGADNTILYGPEDLPLGFKLRNWRIYYGRTGRRFKRKGAGYWVWKPYIINETLKALNEGDILIYSDGASVYVGDIANIIETMDQEKLNIMIFSLGLQIERQYTKRDAFVLMDADTPEYTDSRQRIATYVIFRKCQESSEFVNEWLNYSLDYRIITDEKNKTGKDNYPEFVDHRNDQSILSLLAKKRGIREYRDPSQYGNNESEWPTDIIERSHYPQIWYSTRDWSITTKEDFYQKIPNPHKVIG